MFDTCSLIFVNIIDVSKRETICLTVQSKSGIFVHWNWSKETVEIVIVKCTKGVVNPATKCILFLQNLLRVLRGDSVIWVSLIKTSNRIIHKQIKIWKKSELIFRDSAHIHTITSYLKLLPILPWTYLDPSHKMTASNGISSSSHLSLIMFVSQNTAVCFRAKAPTVM